MIFTLLVALTVLVVFIVQVLVITYFSIYGGSVYFILIGVFVFSIRYGARDGCLYGFLNGIFFDVFSTRLFGFEALVFSTAGYACGLLSRRLDETLLSVQYIISTSICVFYFFISRIVLNAALVSYSLIDISIATLSTVGTVICTSPFYKLFNWWFARIEKWSGKANQV